MAKPALIEVVAGAPIRVRFVAPDGKERVALVAGMVYDVTDLGADKPEAERWNIGIAWRTIMAG